MTGHPRLRKAASAVHRKLAPQWARRNAWEAPAVRPHVQALVDAVRRLHAQQGLSRRLARCPESRWSTNPEPCLYVDLDVAFTADLTRQCADKAWAYRWETFPFANSAILYLPQELEHGTHPQGQQLENFLPWILFADHVCSELGVWSSEPGCSIRCGTRRRCCTAHGQVLRARDNLAVDMHACPPNATCDPLAQTTGRRCRRPNSIYSGLRRPARAFTSERPREHISRPCATRRWW